MSDHSMTSEDPVVLTPAAREKATEYLKKEGREVVRVTFDANGNPGLELDKLRPGDRTFSQGGATVAVAESILEYVKGLEVDFLATGPEVGFKFGGKAQALDKAIGLKAREILASNAPAADHGGSHVKQYMSIFYILIVLTALELGCTWLPVGKGFMIALLMVLAVTKATLVGMYFMHLKFEGRWKNVILVPPVILAVILVFALMPDVGLAEHGPASRIIETRSVPAEAEHH